MMEIEQLKKLITKQYLAEIKDKFELPPDAEIVTGNPIVDKSLHYLKTVSGIKLKLTPDGQQIEAYSIINPEKFMWFTLKWS